MTCLLIFALLLLLTADVKGGTQKALLQEPISFFPNNIPHMVAGIRPPNIPGIHKLPFHAPVLPPLPPLLPAMPIDTRIYLLSLPLSKNSTYFLDLSSKCNISQTVTAVKGCSSVLVCLIFKGNSLALHVDCLPGQSFDFVRKSCGLYDLDSSCFPRQPVSQQCPSGEGLYPSKTSCSEFYKCVDSEFNGIYTTYQFECASGMYFDQKKKTCQPDVATLCNKTINVSPLTTTTPSPLLVPLPSNCSLAPPNPQAVNCTSQGLFSDPSDCSAFYRCQSWQASTTATSLAFIVYFFRCPVGNIFHPVAKVCVLPELIKPAPPCLIGVNQTVATMKPTDLEVSTSKPSSTTPSTMNLSSTTKAPSSTTASPSTTTPSFTLIPSSSTKAPSPPSSTTAPPTTTTPSFTMIPSSSTKVPLPPSSTTASPSTTTPSFTMIPSSSTKAPLPPSSTTASPSTTTPSFTMVPSSSTKAPISNMTVSSTTSSQTTALSSTIAPSASTKPPTVTPPSTTGPVTPASLNVCAELSSGQHLFACPSGFRRHPKYCDRFYQCTENSSGQLQVLVLRCVQGFVFDGAHQACRTRGPLDNNCTYSNPANQSFYVNRQLPEKQHPEVEGGKKLCTAEGTFAFPSDCLHFVKCTYDDFGVLRGTVKRCPHGFIFWTVSHRCELELKVEQRCHDKDPALEAAAISVDYSNIGQRSYKMMLSFV